MIKIISTARVVSIILLMCFMQSSCSDKAESRNSYRDEFGNPMLYRFIANDDMEGMSKYLEDHPDSVYVKGLMGGGSAIFEAVRQNNVHAVKILLDHGANINEQLERSSIDEIASMTADLTGWSLLHTAVDFKHKQMIRFLLENDINTQLEFKFNGTTALEYALEYRPEMAEFIEDNKGIDN